MADDDDVVTSVHVASPLAEQNGRPRAHGGSSSKPPSGRRDTRAYPRDCEIAVWGVPKFVAVLASVGIKYYNSSSAHTYTLRIYGPRHGGLTLTMAQVVCPAVPLTTACQMLKNLHAPPTASASWALQKCEQASTSYVDMALNPMYYSQC